MNRVQCRHVASALAATIALSLVSCAPRATESGSSGAAASAGHGGVEAQAIALADPPSREAVRRALDGAGGNASELAQAIVNIDGSMRRGMVFLVTTMPERDRTSLSAEFLVSNVELAYAAWRGAPWGAEVDEETFFRYVLPYVNLNERRDDWRADFARRFQAEAWKRGTRIEAVAWLNTHLNDAVNVHYHASKRRKPDQSPYESMELSWASCTGLSILLVDACRACGIPARCVGCPAWTKVTGNHTWVEVFAEETPGAAVLGERWFNVGDTGSDPRGENWVNERCREETDPDDWAHAVWAATWRPTGRHFPLPWEWEIEYVPAVNVTRLYKEPVLAEVALPRPGPAVVEATLHDDIVARVRVLDATDRVPMRLAAGETFAFTVRYPDGSRESFTMTP